MSSEKYRKAAKLLIRAGQILENIADIEDDASISSELKEEQTDKLMGEYLVQMLKIQNMSI